MLSTKFMLSYVLSCKGLQVFCNVYVSCQYNCIVLNVNTLFESCLFKEMQNWIKTQLKDPC